MDEPDKQGRKKMNYHSTKKTPLEIAVSIALDLNLSVFPCREKTSSYLIIKSVILLLSVITKYQYLNYNVYMGICQRFILMVSYNKG